MLTSLLRLHSTERVLLKIQNDIVDSMYFGKSVALTTLVLMAQYGSNPILQSTDRGLIWVISF